MIELQTETSLFGDELAAPAKIDRDMLARGLFAMMKDATIEEFVACLTNRFEAVIDYANLCAGQKTGQRISLLFNPHRLSTATKMRSISEAMKDARWWDGVARVALLKDGTTRDMLYAIIGMGVNHTSYIQEFPPHVARDLALEYGLSKSSRVLDPCAGWGGRMLGFSAVVDSYTCCEPSTRTAAGLQGIAAFIRGFRAEFDATIHEAPFEDIDLPLAAFDFAMTSPPYFDTERYAPDEPTNSCNRYTSFDSWVTGFFTPLVHRTMAALKPDASFLLNIGSRVYPLSETLRRVGYEYRIERHKCSALASNGIGRTGEGETFYEIRQRPGTLYVQAPEPVEASRLAEPESEPLPAETLSVAAPEPAIEPSEPVSEPSAVEVSPSAADVAEALKARGHRLLTLDGKLFVTRSKRLTDADREAIRQHKPALLLMAERAPEPPAPVVEPPPVESLPTTIADLLTPDSLFDTNPQIRSKTLVEFLGIDPPRSAKFDDWRPCEPPSLTNIDTLEFDTETTGLAWWEQDRPIGLSCRRPDGSTFYLPWGHAGGNLDEAAVKRWAERELRGKHLIGANIKFDVHMMHAWGVDLEAQGCTVSDVQHYAALLDDTRKKFNLDILAKEFLGKEKIKSLDKTRMAGYHAAEVAEYAERDVALTGELRQVMWPMLDAEDLQRVRQLEDDVIFPVCEMERNGAPVDGELLDRWVKESEAKLNEILYALARETGRSINPDSPQDMETLFDHLGLPVTRLTSGAGSFTDAILKRIDHPIVKQARLATKLSDLRSRYLLKYQSSLDSHGILRYALHQTRYQKDSGEEGGTGPGRFSSSELADGVGCNIQQLMKVGKQRKAFGYSEKDASHDDEIHLVRRLLVPEPGSTWLCADLMQVEYRLFAHYAGTPGVIDAYRQNPMLSFHDHTLQEFVKHKPDMTYDEQKTFNFAVMYGASTIKQAVMLGFITEAEAGELRANKDWNSSKLARMQAINRVFDRVLPEARPLMKRASKLAEERGFVKTMLGRRSRFEKDKRFHKAINNVLQGGAADYNKLKVVELHRERKYTGLKLRFTVHDEVDGDAQMVETRARVAEVLDAQSWPQLKVPLLWDCKTGANLAAAK